MGIQRGQLSTDSEVPSRPESKPSQPPEASFPWAISENSRDASFRTNQ